MSVSTDPPTYRCAIRQADMILRRAADRALVENRTATGKISALGKKRHNLIMALADEVWTTLGKHPPETVERANEIDAEIEKAWRKVGNDA